MDPTPGKVRQSGKKIRSLSGATSEKRDENVSFGGGEGWREKATRILFIDLFLFLFRSFSAYVSNFLHPLYIILLMRQSSLVVLSALFLLSSHYTYADNNTSTDRYILVFKPTATHADIHEHLKLLTQTPRQNASQFLVEEATTAYSTIGQFRWASGVFDPATIDQLAHTHQHQFAVDYYIPDVTFSLQEVIQTDPPSWVSLFKPMKTKRTRESWTGMVRVSIVLINGLDSIMSSVSLPVR